MIYNSPPFTHRSIKVIHLKGRAPWVIFPDDPSLQSHRLVPPRSPGGRVGARPAGEVRDRAARCAVVLEGAEESPRDESPPTYKVRKISIQFRLGVGAEQNIWKLGRSIPTTYLGRHFSPVGAPPK